MNDSHAVAAPPAWRRWLIEGSVIVLSILLAFGIDAWWEERQERVDEREILAGLDREFADYRARLLKSIERHEQMMGAMEALLKAMDTGSWQPSGISLDEAVGKSLYPPTTELGGGVRDALVQAGELELISDRDLREKLAMWPGIYNEVLDDEIFSRNMVFDHLLPHLSDQAYDFSGVFDFLVRDWPIAPSGIGLDAGETERLLSDKVYRAKLQIRYSYWDHAGQEYQAALAAAEEILQGIARAREAVGD